MERKKTVLTGIKPTGTPHLGNLMGAIRPALEMAKKPELDPYFFIADYHALTTVQDGKTFRNLVHEVAATWIACGLDPARCTIYCQSDIPEIFELSWILSCVTPKGLMNRAHAYKAVVQENQEKGQEDLDAGVSMGLFCYPVLMAADILMFNSDFVPVGKDQVQHVEITRDIAQRFNKDFKKVFKLPMHVLSEQSAVLPGLDGRKMSKSYDNTIPIFAPSNQLQKLIARVKTDSVGPTDPKNPETSTLFMIYKEISTPEEIEAMKQKYVAGISWGDAKQQTFEKLDQFLAEPRKKYQELMANPAQIEQILKEGGLRARKVATALLAEVRKAVGKI
ncbi:tryptophan--tRNA ligase [bacterium]|nr:tryptophan--tRNA ligase [bacterium]